MSKALDIQCPECGAAAGIFCITTPNNELGTNHNARYDAAEKGRVELSDCGHGATAVRVFAEKLAHAFETSAAKLETENGGYRTAAPLYRALAGFIREAAK